MGGGGGVRKHWRRDESETGMWGEDCLEGVGESGRNLGKLMPSNVLCHIPLGLPLTIAFEKPVEGGLLAPPTEFLSLVHQSLLDCLLSAQHHNSARSQVDGEYRTVTLADLMEEKDQRS